MCIADLAYPNTERMFERRFASVFLCLYKSNHANKKNLQSFLTRSAVDFSFEYFLVY